MLVTRTPYPKAVAPKQPEPGTVEVSRDDWVRLTTPDSALLLPIRPGIGSEKDVFTSMEQVRAATDALDFHTLDPFVASVASAVDGRSVSEPDKAHVESVEILMDGYYEEPFQVEIGTHNGPDAPMLLILPGIYGTKDGTFSKQLKKIALERGMNYTIASNPLNAEMLKAKPINHPGNIQVEAEVMHGVLSRLAEQRPEYFQTVSLAGYSYGGLLAANIARYDELKGEESGVRVIKGGVVTISPPQDLSHSMLELDSLRERYAEGGGSITATGAYYSREVSRLGYERFMESDLAKRGEGTNITEIKISDHYGSRDEMKDMVVTVDEHFGHNHLPAKWPNYFKRRKVINEMTYASYSNEWFSKDEWLNRHGLTPEELGARNSYKAALAELDHTPVLTLLSQDDYILSPSDVETYQDLAAGSNGLEYTRVFPRGGHVGLFFNPKVKELVGDFAFSGKALAESAEQQAFRAEFGTEKRGSFDRQP